MMQQLLQGQQVQAKALNQVTTEMDTRMGNMFTELNNKYDTLAIHIRKIDVQLAQIVESVKRQQGTLPGKTDKNPRTEHCNAIEQPFAETVLGAEENTKQSASSGATAPSEPAETLPVRVYVPMVPYPIPPKHLMDPISAEQLAGFRKMVRRLPQKISFEHAWEIRPLHTFFKNYRESQEEIKALFNEALTPSLKVLPKADDSGKFVFPCSIAGVEFKEALCNSGSSVNLVSKAIVDELGIVDVEPSQVKLAFANSSMTVPYGTIRNFPVQVGDYVLHTEFQVVEMRNDHEMPLIFGRAILTHELKEKGKAAVKGLLSRVLKLNMSAYGACLKAEKSEILKNSGLLKERLLQVEILTPRIFVERPLHSDMCKKVREEKINAASYSLLLQKFSQKREQTE
ncbi:PREDICTED: uncharacterized protein LOC106344992 [Brassica oleracea var. oleracea]|uniref:uncharacterized protein LOC106344992 n=1 Tax=Brassica oleracea var. oleracea TaxID=109376 RepID=UPI0006A6FFA4|nr:PREDICTED: uncharacterized protein LOC106344992 [Brassica oleracea var. oleracea]